MSILRVIQPSTSQNERSGVQSQRQAIAILLLDAENIQLCVEEERFLETCCKHSLQIKIAFANWRAVSKQQDLELHERGYQMIHVPAGKNSADMKMTAVGSSLFVTYPNVKEVLVCSSDGDLAHLCNTLQIYGLSAYAVRRQSESLHVTNVATGQIFNHQQQRSPSIALPLEECLIGIKALIQAQQQLTSSQWVQLSWLSKKFQETYGFTIRQWVNQYMPGKKVRDLFLDRPNEYVIHQVAEKSAIHISLFTYPEPVPVPLSVLPANPPPVALTGELLSQSLPSVRSKQQLEKALLKILKTQTGKTNTRFILLTNLLSEFQKQHEKTLKHFLEVLGIKNKALVFLKSCQGFELKQVGKIWQVSVKR